MSDPRDPIYRVIEMTDAGAETKIVSVPNARQEPFSYNAKHRMYPRLQEAQTYKKRLAKEGRDGRILKFVFEGEVD